MSNRPNATAQISGARLLKRAPRRSNSAWFAILCRAVALVILCGSMGAGASAQVDVLVERGASTYQQAVQGFRSEIGDAFDPKELAIDETGRLPKDVIEGWRRSPPRLVIAT